MAAGSHRHCTPWRVTSSFLHMTAFRSDGAVTNHEFGNLRDIVGDAVLWLDIMLKVCVFARYSHGILLNSHGAVSRA